MLAITMAYVELILSESEWQRLVLIKEHVKQLFNVDIRRKDELDEGDDEGTKKPLLPSYLVCFNRDNNTSAGNEISYDFYNFAEKKSFVDTNNGKQDFTLCAPPVIVRIETSTYSDSESKSQGGNLDLEKCQKFTYACTPSHEYFKHLALQLEDQHSFEMVKAHSTDIEKTAAALVNFFPDQLVVTIQGHANCVQEATDKVNMIIVDNKLPPDEKDAKTDDYSTHFYNKPQSGLPEDEEDKPNFATLIEKEANRFHLQNHLSFSPETENQIIMAPQANIAVTYSPTLHDVRANRIDELSNGDDFDLTLSSLSLCEDETKEESEALPEGVTGTVFTPFQCNTESHQDNLHPRCDDSLNDSDSEEDNILTDVRFKNRIEQATKCGYSDQQVVNVLKRLGGDCSMNDMMQELLKEPKEQQEADENDVTSPGVLEKGSRLERDEDSDDSDNFDVNDSSNLRHIVIDGSNVAMSHGQKLFSCLGIKIVVDWFKNRGHKNITVFVPSWRKEASRPDAPIMNQEILTELESERIVVYTPSRRVGGTRIVCYDDRFVLQYAAKTDGIVVSNDVYRDLVREGEDFREVVEKRLLMYSFAKDTFMPPEDPLGRQGPSLDNFLRIKPAGPRIKPANCPYGKKCTYGIKCKFYHPERRYTSQKMVAEKLKESAEQKLRASKTGKSDGASSEKGRRPKPKLSRTLSLLPQASDGSSLPDKVCEDISTSKKPSLQHSKSLVYPISTSYLTESRVKMEQAEMVSQHQYTPVSPNQDKSKDLSNNCIAGPRTSPTPGSDAVKAKVKTVKSFPSSPVPNAPTHRALTHRSATASSFAVPNQELDARFLSGHLLVTKKMSDEEIRNGNFFLKHTSRPPGASQPEQNFDSHHLSADNLMSTRASPFIVHQIPDIDSLHSDQLSSHSTYFPPGVPSHTTQHNRTVVSPPTRTSSTCPYNDGNHFPPSSYPVISSPTTKEYNSCPIFFQKEDVYQVSPHQNFHRSLSSSTPAKSLDFQPKRPTDRKYSLNISNTKANDFQQMKTLKHQPGVESHQNISYYQHLPAPVTQPRYQRQRVSFDSSYNPSGLCMDQNTPLFTPTSDMNAPLNKNTATVNYNNRGIVSPNPKQPIAQPHGTVYQAGASRYDFQGSGSIMIKPGSGHAAPISPWQHPPPLPHNTGMAYAPPFQDPTSRGMVPPSSGIMTLPSSPSPYSSQPQQMMMIHHIPPPNLLHQSQAQLAPVFPPSYTDHSYQLTGAHGTCGVDSTPLDPNATVFPYMQAPQSQPAAKTCDEEAPISTDDPRYSIYYNLSPLYGEKAVRTFMNRNPDVKGFNELCTLISSYKQDLLH